MTYIKLKQENKEKLPVQFQSEDVRYADDFVRYCLSEFSTEGSVVFDPFAGFGTTLLIAEEMGRQPYGLEFDPERCKYIKERISNPDHVICGDARHLSDYELPEIDVCLTSPPYMNKFDHLENPLTAYSTSDSCYEDYLAQLQNIYAQIARIMKASAHALVEISNLKSPGGVTPLACDVGEAISKVLKFEGERILCWDKQSYGYAHSYCLVYSLR